MRVIFMGTPEFAVPVLERVARDHEVVAVYTQPPRPAGRGQKDRPSPVQVAAERLGLEVRHPPSLKPEAEIAAFEALKADVAVVVAYGLILRPRILAAPRFGCLNVHASILPRWRGAAPIHRAVLAGDTETGVAIMAMEEGLDTGPVYLERRTPIGPEDTTADLHDRLADLGAEAMAEVLADLPRRTPVPQSAEGATYAAKIDKAEARIDWSHPAADVDRQIRGLSPFPGAWTMLGGKRLKLLRSRPAGGAGAPGEVLSGFKIACGSGAVEVLEAQIEGRGRQTADDFLRGTPLPPGTILGD
jgi:methionyl-tRNA formyltransferase